LVLQREQVVLELQTAQLATEQLKKHLEPLVARVSPGPHAEQLVEELQEEQLVMEQLKKQREALVARVRLELHEEQVVLVRQTAQLGMLQTKMHCEPLLMLTIRGKTQVVQVVVLLQAMQPLMLQGAGTH
jgi:hypothetical protein